MTGPASLQRLLTWLSPAFPVGAFAWSAGLETAISDRRVTDSTALQKWIAGALHHGGLRTDAILLAQAWQVEGPPHPSRPAAEPPSPARGEGEPTAALSSTAVPSSPSPLAGEGGAQRRVRRREERQLADLADLCLALTPAAERHRETLLTGDAFVIAARAWPSDVYDRLPSPCPYPIAVGAIAAAHGIAIENALLGYLTAAVHAQVSVAVRLVPLGQSDGLKVMAALEPAIAGLAAAAAITPLDEIGGIAYAADIAQMRHETLEPRIFRS